MEGEVQHQIAFDTRGSRAFRWMVGVSIGVHVAAAVAIIFGSMAPPRRLNENKAIQTKLVKLGQDKPDLLPRMDTPPPPPKAAPAVVSPTPAPAPVPVATKPVPAKEEKKSSFEDSLKRLEQMEKKQDDFKGKGDPRGSKSGTVSDFTKQMVGMQWVSDVEARIRPNLNIPSVIPDADRAALKVTITLYVAPNGRVTKKSVQSSSGNALFDTAVMRAIEASSPLPPPPNELRDQVQSEGVDVEFLGRK